MNQAENVQAVFVPVQYQLSAKINGAGKIVAAPKGLDCSAECASRYDSGTSVRLVALPGPEQRFTGWSGESCSGSYSVCNLKADKDQAVVASFEPIPRYPLAVKVDGYGTVRSRFGTITCPKVCSSDVLENTQVWLEVVVPAGQKFAGWGGDCQGSEKVCIIPMKAARNVSARFENIPPIMHHLGVKTSLGGDIRTDLGDINCGLLCSNQYIQNSFVKLKAYPQPGYRLKGWSGTCQVIMFICSLKMDQAQQVQAQFEKIPPHTLQVVVVGRGWGRVTSKAVAIDCASNCRKTLDSSLLVELAQQPKPGYQFLQWSGACQGAGVCRVAMTNLRTVYAVYRKEHIKISAHDSSSPKEGLYRGL